MCLASILKYSPKTVQRYCHTLFLHNHLNKKYDIVFFCNSEGVEESHENHGRQ